MNALQHLSVSRLQVKSRYFISPLSFYVCPQMFNRIHTRTVRWHEKQLNSFLLRKISQPVSFVRWMVVKHDHSAFWILLPIDETLDEVEDCISVSRLVNSKMKLNRLATKNSQNCFRLTSWAGDRHVDLEGLRRPSLLRMLPHMKRSLVQVEKFFWALVMKSK